MKVVLFCGGYGMRMRDGVNDVPKPMALVGDQPLLWNVMRFYAHYGHREFILALGYGAHHITDFFANYDPTQHNDFRMRPGAGPSVAEVDDVPNWDISFVHTGIETPIGERLRRVRARLGDDEIFMANYADVLTDVDLHEMEAQFRARDAAASLLAVRPEQAFHMVDTDERSMLTGIRSVSELNVRENGGYFILTPEIFDHLGEGEELVTHAIPRLARTGRVYAHRHDGFWMPADTVKERSVMDSMARNGTRPWAIWDTSVESKWGHNAPSYGVISDPGL